KSSIYSTKPYLTRKSLCEIRYRDTTREVAAFMAYESAK
ncbi:Hok/Gef family protein, partial [Klebsiella variicola]